MPNLIPTVFLSGLLCDRMLWQQQILALGGQIAPFVADLTQQDTIRDMASDVLAKAPPRFALAGLSMGGYVAFEILRQAPERVLKLCLVDTSARPDTPEQQEKRRGLIMLSKSGKFKGITPRLMPQLVHPSRMQDAALTGLVMAMAERVGREAFQRQQTAILNRPDSRPTLRAITCPTLVVGGRQDLLTPLEITREIAEGIPQANFAIVEHCGHLPPIEQPEKMTMLMRSWVEN